MMECEVCGRNLHADETQKCPECELEVCDKCYQDHVKSHFVDDFDEE